MEILLRVFQRTILSVIHPVFFLPDHSRDLYCRKAVSFNIILGVQMKKTKVALLDQLIHVAR